MEKDVTTGEVQREYVMHDVNKQQNGCVYTSVIDVFTST